MKRQASKIEDSTKLTTILIIRPLSQNNNYLKGKHGQEYCEESILGMHVLCPKERQARMRKESLGRPRQLTGKVRLAAYPRAADFEGVDCQAFSTGQLSLCWRQNPWIGTPAGLCREVKGSG